MKRLLLLSTVFAITALLGGALPALGQGVTTSAMRGTVFGEDGEPLPGANVLAVHEPTETRYGATTGGEGTFNIRNMRVGGPYRVEISYVGFQRQERTGIQLVLGETYELQTVELSEAATELEAVQVTAARASEQSGIETSISEQDIERQPSVGRSLADFTRMTPQAYVANDDDDGAAISIAGQNNRYNSIFIDGAVSNDVFGLSAQGTDGGQTGATPISIDAIEAFQVNISPFDVTQSGFTGAAINAVTRSGSNEFEGSAAYFRRSADVAGIGLVEDLDGGASYPNFSDDRYVARLGGPIVRDKLFFFANADFRRSSSPQPFVGFGGQNGYQGATSADGLNDLTQFLIDETGYDPGAFGDKNATLDSDKVLGKLDWNINDNHRASVRYSYAGSDNIDAFRSDDNTINFTNRSEVFPNTTHIAAGELNSTFGQDFANKLIISYKSVTDDRGIAGAQFPTVNIDDGPGNTIQLGPEPFSTANLLEQDVYTLTNNFNWFLGEHTLTFGTHNEFYELGNLFIPYNFGWYFFEDQNGSGTAVDEFRQAVRAVNDPSIETPNNDVQRSFSLVDNQVGDASSAIGAFNAFQLGFYAQDEWQASERLSLTAGLRLNIPKVTSDPSAAPDANSFTLPRLASFYDLNGARAGEAPDAQFLWEPRVGFNFDAMGDGRTQVRGGTGVFTSRVPFVWVGGMFTNNGANTGGFNSDNAPNPFRPDPTNGLTPADVSDRSAEDLIPSGRLEVFEDDFKFPRVWRTSLGVDQQLPYGVTATLEGQYTNTISNIAVTNINLRPANETLDGPDNRPIWVYDRADAGQTGATDGTLIDDRYTNIHRVGNTSRGYTYDVTAQLQKDFGEQITTSLSYTYGDAFSVNDGLSSQLNSIWDGPEHVDGANNLGLARSDFSIGNRILGRFSYRQEFLGNLATTISLFYTGESGRPFSYTIADSDQMVGENGDPVSLFYVPRNASQLELAPIVQGGEVVRTVAQQRNDLNRFIDGNAYLSSRRGDYAERNGDRTPFENIVDLQISQQVFGNLLDRTQRAEITLDIFNFTSMLGDVFGTDWGTRYFGTNSYNIVDFQGFLDPEGEDDDDGNDFTPVYQSALGTSNPDTDKDDIFNEIQTGSTYSSQWQIQLGLRYTF